ncbi:MAG: DUF4013 domain-containing protein [Chloroflexi bacterium]|nr:MAG: DUF4013 domain-containing protein [Chloroflexota bacterium]
MNSVGDAFGFPFRDREWVGKIVVQALILIIPIVGLIATAGWMLMTFDNLRAGRQELAPAGFHLSRGIGLFGAWLIYAIVLSIPGDILSGIGSGINANHGYYGGPFTGLGSVLSFGAQLLLYFLLPSIIVMTYHHGFSGGLDVPGVWRLATSNVNNSVVAGLMMFVAGLVAAVGLVACCIGVFFTGAYAAVVMTGVASWFERMQAQPSGAAPPA